MSPTIDLRLGDCLEIMPTLEVQSFDAISERVFKSGWVGKVFAPAVGTNHFNHIHITA